MDEVGKKDVIGKKQAVSIYDLKDRLLVFCTRKRSLTPSTIRNNDRLVIGFKNTVGDQRANP